MSIKAVLLDFDGTLADKGHYDTFQNNKGIVDSLHFLKAHGMKIGILTGKSKHAFQLVFETLHLPDLFDIAITDDDVDKAKPDPQGLNKALHLLGLDQSSAVFISDSPKDILAAKAAGLYTHGVRWLSTCPDLVYDAAQDRIDYIREEEKKYHEHCYENNQLFAEGSWLHKPVKTVMDLFSHFEGKNELAILDLGCGVGRNSIPMAEIVRNKKGQIICVDLLDSALAKLEIYSKESNVEDIITPVKSDIEEYCIAPDHFDIIVAVSSLEHVRSIEKLDKVLRDMAIGTKNNGVNCLIINTNVRETDLTTNESLEPLIEINLTTEQAWSILDHSYSDWERITNIVKPLEFEISRDGKPVLLSSDCITLVVKKIE